MLNRSSENFFLAPNLKEKQLQISLSVLIMMQATGVLRPVTSLRKFFTIPSLLIVFIINVFWILPNAFSAFIEMIIY